MISHRTRTPKLLLLIQLLLSCHGFVFLSPTGMHRQSHPSRRRISMSAASSNGSSRQNQESVNGDYASADMVLDGAVVVDDASLLNISTDTSMLLKDGSEVNTTSASTFDFAPPLSFQKFLTMQEKRVVVTIMYSGDSGLRPFYLTTAKFIKKSFPDVLIEQRVLPKAGENEKGLFEIQVDGKVVVKNKNRSKEMNRNQNVFVSMDAISAMIVKARRRRRPSTVYAMEQVNMDGMDAAAVRLQIMRQKNRNSEEN